MAAEATKIVDHWSSEVRRETANPGFYGKARYGETYLYG
jgi:hypothetical protein